MTLAHDRGLCALPLHQQHALEVAGANLQRLGGRVISEVLLELVQRPVDLPSLLAELDRLRDWTPDVLDVTRADGMPPRALRAVAS